MNKMSAPDFDTWLEKTRQVRVFLFVSTSRLKNNVSGYQRKVFDASGSYI